MADVQKPLTSTPVTSGVQSAITGSAAGTASGIAGMAGTVLAGLTGFEPQFKDNSFGSEGWKRDNPEKWAAVLKDINEYKAGKAADFGGDYQKYLDSKRPPISPLQADIDEAYSNGEGDKDYQIDQLNQFYQSAAGKAKMQEFYKANPEWYTPDGKRIYKDQDDINAIIKLHAAGQAGVEPLTTSQKEAAVANGLDPEGTVDAPGGSSTGNNTPAPVVDQDIVGNAVNDAVSGTQSQLTDRINNPTLPDGAKFTYTPQEAKVAEMLTPQGKILGAAALAAGDDIALQAAQAKDLGLIDVTTIGENVVDLDSIHMALGENSKIEDVQAEVSDRFNEQFAANQQMLDNFQVFQGSTVKEQFALLQDDWVGANGQSKVPFYALGAVTAAKQEMNARGMGGSSMAAAAITQAGLEAMMPAAMADAQFFQTLSVKSFDYQTSMGLAKLSHIANLDMSQLEHRQRIAVDTANKFFQVDMSNVENDRLVAATNNANRMQALFSDQNYKNAAANLQFTTQAEQDRFYDQLSLSAQEATSRLLMTNRQFNASVENTRAEFNSKMAMEIERDNVNYLRSINTANTAAENQQNLINSQNLLGISNTATANALTLQRDQLNRIFESSENIATRANNYAIAKLSADAAMNRLTAQQDHENGQDLGGFLGSIAKPFIDQGVSWGIDALFGTNTATS